MGRARPLARQRAGNRPCRAPALARLAARGTIVTQAFTFRFEDREIEARPGQSLAAALLAAGEAGLRETRTGGLRGLYCGMGVCQECLVRVEKDNQPAEQVRACMTPAQP